MTDAAAPASALDTLRPAELAAARAALQPAGGTLLITGDPGVGKRTLAKLAIAAITEDLPATNRPRLIELTASATLADIPFSLLSGELPANSLADLLDPESVFRVALTQFDTASGGTILLVVDADSADEASLNTLVSLSEHANFRTVFTARDERSLPRPIGQFLAQRRAVSVLLDPLAHAQLTSLASHLLGGATIEAETAARLHHATGGNPLFLVEVLAQLQRTGALQQHGTLVNWAGDGSATSRSLPEFLRLVLSQTDPRTRSALLTVACAEPVLLGNLTALADIADPDAIDRLLTQRVIRQDAGPDGAPVLRTSNQVIGDTVRSAMSPGERLRLLTRISETLPQDLATAPADTLLRGVGLLLDLGRSPGHEALLRALDLARGASDHRMVIRISRVLSTHPELSDTEKLSAAAARLRAARLRGDPALLSEPDLLTTPHGFSGSRLLPQPSEPAADTLARAELALARAEIMLYRDDDVSGALAMLEEFHAACGPAGSPASQRLLVGRTICLGYAGRFREAMALAQSEISDADTADSVHIAGTRTLIAGQSGQLNEARGIAWRALAQAHSHTQQFPMAAGEIFAALFAVEIANGQVGAAAQLLDALHESLEQPTRDYRPGSGLVGIGTGLLALAEGRWVAAAAEFGASADTLRGTDGTGFAQIALAGQALALAAGGHSDEAWEALRDLQRTPGRASRIAEGLVRLNAVSARLWLNDATAVTAAADLAAWARGHELALIELRALHLRALSGPPPSAAEQERATLLGESLDVPFARDLVEAITERETGGPIRDSPAIRRLARQGVWTPLSWPPTLTPREREVAGLAVLGYSTKHIAQTLAISSRTAESHLARTFEKLGVHDRDGLATLLKLRHTLRSQITPPA